MANFALRNYPVGRVDHVIQPFRAAQHQRVGHVTTTGLEPPPLPKEGVDVVAAEVSRQSTAFARKMYRRFLVARSRRGVPKSRLVWGILLCLGVVTAPWGIGLIISAFVRKNEVDAPVKPELEWINGAELVLASPLMVNSMLRRPGTEAAPGLFLIYFFDGRNIPLAEVAEVVRMIEAPPEGASAADRLYLKNLMGDLEYARNRRRPLPASISGGRVYYVVDLAVSPWYLLNNHISNEMPFVPCLAERGETGKIRAIPYWTAVNDLKPPPHVGKCPILLA
jgi:hypothetical protein